MVKLNLNTQFYAIIFKILEWWKKYSLHMKIISLNNNTLNYTILKFIKSCKFLKNKYFIHGYFRFYFKDIKKFIILEILHILYFKT